MHRRRAAHSLPAGFKPRRVRADEGEEPRVSEQTETKFEKWVKQFGVSRLVSEMRSQGHSITESGVYHWLRGQHEPRPPKVRAMVKLSAGEVTSADVLDHFVLKSGVEVAR